MGLHLIAFSLLNPEDLLVAFEVALGIGAVIFVHELGHFAVAKWCGVKCEKFYLGFDIGGWKLCKFRWGETEYGIGILPLGGYVKMLGQEDNPARMAEEMERAKLQAAEGEPVEGQSQAAPLFDPRSFLAKTVPQRMAIISAGVIMNIIFAFVVFTYCYGVLGVEQVACVVGNVLSGGAAWRAGLQTGDEITQIADQKNPLFRDLQRGVNLGDDLHEGVKFVVKRPGVEEPIALTVFPDRRGAGRLAPMIGIGNGSTRELLDPPVASYSPLARLKDGFKSGDEIVAVDGNQVENEADLERALYAKPGAASITVVRKIKDDETKILNVDTPAIPMRNLGLLMKFGEITAIQENSPAKGAGIREGDRLVKIDGRAVGGDKPFDPMRLPKQLADRAGKTVELTLERDGKTYETSAVLREQEFNEFVAADDGPVPVPALGLAYAVENQVAAVEPGSPAALQNIKPGDVLVKAVLLPPEDAKQKYELKSDPEPADLDFAPDKRNFPVFFTVLQKFPADCKVELTFKGEHVVKLSPQPVEDWLNPDRGLRFKPALVMQKAASLSEAVSLGAAETRDSLSLVYRFLRKILSGQVSVKGMGGPKTIAEQAGQSAYAGLSPFLMFLGMLSANLAVINFLPIPLLDGGHMMFLAWEGIRGKAASEQVMTWCQFIGLFFLASLMVFVMLLDFGVIPRS